MAYIEENLKIRSKPREEGDKKKPLDPQEALYQVPERWKVEQKKTTAEEGSITNSMAMLTAIPEVDLGMEYVDISLLKATAITHIYMQYTSEKHRRHRES